MLIGAAQKVEHYEISGYGTVRTLAEAIGNSEVASLLRQTEEEEAETDRKLTAIAAQLVERANSGSENEEEEDEGEDDEFEEDDGESEDDEPDEDVDSGPAKKKAAPKKR